MEWMVVAAAVTVVLFAGVWWQSGRAKPGNPGGRVHDQASSRTEQAHVQSRRGNLGGPGGR